MIYKIEENISFRSNDFHKEMKTNFNFDVELYDRNKEEKFYLVNRKNFNTTQEIDNNFVKLLSDLETINYPIKVKTDTNRKLIAIEDFKNWLNEWKEKANKVCENYGNEDNIKELINNYYSIIQNEEVFIKNKFKEPFWNLFFLKFGLESLEWNIKSIGSINCFGETKTVRPEPGKSISIFKSSQPISELIIEKLKQSTTIEKADWYNEKIELTVESHTDFVEQKKQFKKSNF
jgi:hypothetical protein